MSLKDIFTRTIEVFGRDGELVVKNSTDKTIHDVRVMFGVPAGVAIDDPDFTAAEMAPGEEIVATKVYSIDPEADDRSETIEAEYECQSDGSESKNTLKVSVDV